MKKQLFSALLGIITGAAILTGSGILAKAASINNSSYVYETSATQNESEETDIDRMVEAGTFDSSKLTKKQIKAIEEEYGEDPQAIQELQKQSDYNSTPALSASFGSFTHDTQFDGYDIINGIDVSNWNGEIDWEKVKASGIDFAIIRVAVRYYGSGILDTDDRYKENLKGAIEAGLDVGVYVFSQATTVAEAKEEANYTLNLIKGYDINLPVVMDFEYAGNNVGRLAKAHLSVAEATKICNAFCAEVEKRNYTPMVYANKSLLTNDVNASAIASKYPIWMAQYPGYSSDTNTIQATYEGKYSYWQYSSSGTVPGISGRVDMNLRYIKKPATVKNLTRTASTLKSITLSWDKVPYVYGYKIYRYNAEKDKYEYIGATRGPSNTTYTDTDLAINTLYSYKVRAYYKLRDGNYDGNFSQILNASSGEKIVKNIKVSKATSSTLKVSWDKETEVTGYQVARYNPSTDKYEVVATINDPDTTSFEDTKLKSGTTYTYKVRAFINADGSKVYFDYSDAKSKSTIPGCVKGLRAVSATDTTISLKWTKQDVATGYKLYMLNSATGEWDKIATIKDGSTNTYTVTGLTKNKKYRFSIIANYTLNDTTGKTERSETLVTYTTPTQIKKFAVKSATTNSVKLTWSAQTKPTGYVIYMKDSVTKKWERIKVIKDVTKTSYKVKDLNVNSTYSFKIKSYRTVDGKTYFGPATTVTTRTKAEAVKKLTLTKHGDNYLLTWNPQDDVTGYYVYGYNPKSGKYKKLKTIKGSSHTMYVASKKQSSTYKYVVRAYKITKGVTYKGLYSKAAVSSKKTAKCTVTGSIVNVRTGGGVNHKVITTVKSGTVLNIIDIKYNGSETWYKVTFKEKGTTVTGYIISNYTKIKNK